MIWIRNLSKSFGALRVLDNVSVAVREGAVTAVLGPNASGKSTLIKCILGLVSPDGGEIFVDDESIANRWRYRTKLGYMPQTAKFPDNLTVGEVFSMVKDIRGCDHRGVFLDEELYESFELPAVTRRRLGTLSGGTRQKVNAAIAFLFSPQVLVLDEPTVGLDPLSAAVFKDKVRKERIAGKTVMLTSHLVGEVEELADHVVFMLEGRPRFDGPVDELKRLTSETKLERAIVRLMENPDERPRDENPEVRNS